MGIVADRLDSMELTETSPDGHLTAVYKRAGGVSLAFNHDVYSSYRERALASQLGRLCMQLWVAYRRAYAAALSEATGQDVKRFLHPKEDPDANRNRFRAEQAETVSQGMSSRELIYFESTGLVRWNVVIRDGTLDELDEDEFARESVSAYDALMTDYREKMIALRAKHYGAS